MKKAMVLMIAVLMLILLAGCDSAAYQKAVSLYESGSYAEAIENFEGLGDYEDSIELLEKCRVAYASELIDSGEYEAARKQLQKAERTDQVEKYLRISAWGMVRKYLEEEGSFEEKDNQYDVESSTQIESVCEIYKQGKSVAVNIQSSEVISYPILSANQTTITRTTVTFDGKEMQPELESKAEVTFKGTRNSSTFYNVGTCLWDIAAYEADAPLIWEEYIHIDSDGAMDDTRSAPAFNRRVSMQQTIITGCLERILEDVNPDLTMADLGFVNY